MINPTSEICPEVQPGIYRTTLGSYGPPGLEETTKPGEDDLFEGVLKLTPINKILDKLRARQEECGEEMGHVYFKDPLAFFRAWQKEYETPDSKTDELKRFERGFGPGFELQYVSWDTKDLYHRIGSWKGIDTRGALEGILIVTDLKGICDIRRYMALGVNDFDKKRVLTYKPKEEVSQSNRSHWKENTLMTDEDVYMRHNFPLESVNVLKRAPYTWISVGFTPKQIYDALKEVDFAFPDEEKR